MKGREYIPSLDFDKFTEFVRKVVSVPREEIDAIKEEERKDKKQKGEKQPIQPTP